MIHESPVSTQKLRSRRSALRNERMPFESFWAQLAESQAPGRLRLYQSDYNDGYDRYANMLDANVVIARRVAVAGFVSGYSSQARPWFRYGTEDRDLAEFGPVKRFLEMAEERARAILERGGFYRMAPNVYDDVLVFGTAAGTRRENPRSLISWHNFAPGETYLATDDYGRPDTSFREVWRTTEQLVAQFGKDRVSTRVQNAYDNSNYYDTHLLIEAVVRNPDHDPARRDVQSMPYAGVYFEEGAPPDKMLGRVGFRTFPNYTPRWYASSGDVYGTDCPGMIALGDNRQLQVQIMNKGEATEAAVAPAMMFPDIFDDDVDLHPRGVTFYDAQYMGSIGPGSAGPMVNRPHFGIEPLLLDINELRERIRQAYYNDLFLMITALEKGDVTATEVERRHEEKLLMLGPTGVHLQDEFLGPVIEDVFNLMILEGVILPEEIPEELEGRNLKIEYIGPLAQVQQTVGLQAVERVVNFASSLAQVKPDILDKVDLDQALDEYALRVGVPSRVVRSDEEVAEIRRQREEQQQAAQLLQDAQPLSQAIRNMQEAAQDRADR